MDLIGGSVKACECGADRTVGGIREELATEMLHEDERSRHPWCYWRTSKDIALPF